MSDKIEVPAVKKEDLEQILTRFGLIECMNTHQLTCTNCSRNLAWDNLGALLVKENGLLLYCNLAECIEEAAKGSKL